LKNRFLTLLGRRYPFGPLAKAARSSPRPRSVAAWTTPARSSSSPARAPAALSRPRQSSPAAWRAHAGDAGQMAPRSPPPARALATTNRPQRLALLLPSFHLALSHTHRPQSCLRHRARHHWRRCSGHSVSPRAAPSCLGLLLPLAQPTLTSTARGKLSLRGNRSPEFRPSSPELSAPWTTHLCPTFFPSSMRILFATTHWCLSTLPVTVPWSEMAGQRPPAPPFRHGRR
jgi:transposase